jgi:hypothetical protein
MTTKRVRASARGSGDGVGRRGELQLDPHPVAVAANDPSPERPFLVVTNRHNVSGLGIEVRVICARTVRKPALDNEISSDLVGVVGQVVTLVSHCSILPVGRPSPHRVRLWLGEVMTGPRELLRCRLG